jgi:ribulose-phosphate 3-epimerase
LVELAFSILAADFAHLAEEIARAERGGGTIVHVDVMDGHFVPNITFGPPVVKAIRPITKLPIDCHLMIEEPDKFIPDFAAAGADMICVHVEVCRHLNRTLQLIADHGVLPAVVLNPATPIEMLVEVLPMVHHVLVMSVNPGFGGQRFLPRSAERIAHLRRLRHEMGLNFRIEVDGGIAGEGRGGHAGRGISDL